MSTATFVQELLLADAAQTEALGAALAQWLQQRGPAVIFLRGDLGAGKTTLARGLLQALGVRGAVRSPTYTLLEPYDLPGERCVLHMDLYRLQDAEELESLGLRDYAPQRCSWLVEWPERAAAGLPSPDLQIELLHQHQQRLARLQATSADDAHRLAPLMDGLQGLSSCLKNY